MFPLIVPALMALAAIWGAVEQLWPSAVGAPVGVQGGQDVLNLVRPLLSWDIAGRDVINLSNKTAQAEELIMDRRLQGQCTAADQQAAVANYNAQCKDACGDMTYKVDTSGCTYKPWGPIFCSCYASCTCYTGDYKLVGLAALENLAWVLLQFLFAVCLWGGIKQAGKADPIPMVGNGSDFESAVCSCFDDCNICICGLFCPVVRASQTLYAASMWGFWAAMLLYGFGFALPGCVGWQGVFFLMRFCFRMQLRQRAGLQPDCCGDCCCTFWCGPCAICQEARHMKKALQASKSGAGPVGGPVVVGAVVNQS